MKCGKPATAIVHWTPQQIIYRCSEHTRDIVALGKLLGHNVPLEPYKGSETCSQEIEERKLP